MNPSVNRLFYQAIFAHQPVNTIAALIKLDNVFLEVFRKFLCHATNPSFKILCSIFFVHYFILTALLKKLPRRILCKRGSKAKAKEIKIRFGITVNHKRIARICRENGLLAKNRRRKFPKDYYKRQEESKKNLPKNILSRDFSADEPLKKLCTDVSYFRTTSGWLYLSPVLDLHRRKVQCYALSRNNDEALADETLDRLFTLGDLSGTILHSDQGPLYKSKEWRQRLRKNGVVQSMSRRGNCWDNACMEHFFGTLKVESGYDDIIKNRTPTEKEVRKLIDNFIEYYNNERIQKNLGWKPPVRKSA